MNKNQISLSSNVSPKLKFTSSTINLVSRSCFNYVALISFKFNAFLGGISLSEDNKKLNQLHSAERDSGITKTKSTLPFGLSMASRDATGRKQRMKVVLDGIVQAVNSIMVKTNFNSLPPPTSFTNCTIKWSPPLNPIHLLSVIFIHTLSQLFCFYTPVSHASKTCYLN